ncbi:hypothetical protein EGW08_016987 [Elysia chlorotica]|uniref:Uncharacterized protein n=1 Tax=Elysia chlorotica TaxID=188477 RepID=A0A433T116_ELYCH|nr:hypothetical protein EGW08_016987 [Elysia chlorotica]
MKQSVTFGSKIGELATVVERRSPNLWFETHDIIVTLASFQRSQVESPCVYNKEAEDIVARPETILTQLHRFLHCIMGSTSYFKSLLLALYIAATVGAENNGAKKYVHHIKVPYFDTVSMTCDHPLLNVSTSPSDVLSIAWVLPDGTNVHSVGDLNHERYTFTGLKVDPTSQSGELSKALDLYNLTASEIDEDQFGYFHCVVTFKTGNGPVAVIRWGLNVNGADFSELLEEYRDNALVGGIAAACLLLLIGGCCLFWNVRNSKQDQEMGEQSIGSDNLKTNGAESAYPQLDNEKKFHNAGYQEDNAVVDVHM